MSEIGVEVVAQDRASPTFAAMARAASLSDEELKKLVASNIQIARAQEEVRKSTEKNRRETASMEKDAQRLKQTLDGALGNYNRDLERATKHLDQGRITQGQFAKAAAAAQEKLEAASAAQSKIAKGAASIAQLAGSYLTLQKGIELATKAMADQEEQRKKSLEATVSVADAQAAALRNLSASSPEEQKAFTERVESSAATIRPKGGVKTMYDLASSALSATGGDVDLAMSSAETAAKVAPDSPSEAATTAGALADLSKVTRARDAETNLGFLVGLGKTARTKDLGALAQNVSKGVIGVHGYGGTAQESGALVTALSQGMADVEGRESATAAISLAKQAEQFFATGKESKETTEAKKKRTEAADALAKFDESKQLQLADRRKSIEDRIAGMQDQAAADPRSRARLQAQIKKANVELAGLPSAPELKPSEIARRAELQKGLETATAEEQTQVGKDKERQEQFSGLTTTKQRIEKLRQDPELRKAFLESASFEAKAQVPVEQVLGLRGGETGKFYDQFQKEIVDPSKAAELGRQMIGNIQKPFEQQVAAGQRSHESAVGSLESSEMGKRRALEGLYSSDKLDELLAKSGATVFGEPSVTGMRGGRAMMNIGATSREEYTGQLQERIATLRTKWYEPLSAAEGRGMENPQGISAERLKAADVLEKHLADIENQYKALTEELRGMRQDAKEQGSTSGGATRTLSRPDKETGVD